MSKPVQTYCDGLMFKIVVEWPDADVDAVYSELGGMYQEHTVSNHRTPTNNSVERFLHAVYEDEELREKEIKVDITHSFMMGCCAITFWVDPSRIAELPALIAFATQRMRALRKEYVRYHRQGRALRGSCVQIISR